MARMIEQEYTILSDREITGTALGTSPSGVAAFSDLQRAVYQDQPADTAEAQAAAQAADTKAAGAQSSADNAQATANQGVSDAATAQSRADAAYTLADGKVSKDVGPSWAVPTAPLSRAALPAYTGTAAATYTQADEQALRDQVATLTKIVAALITDLRGNHSLKN